MNTWFELAFHYVANLAALLVVVFFLSLYYRLDYLFDRGEAPRGADSPRNTFRPIKGLVWLWRRRYLEYDDPWVRPLAIALKWSLVLLPVTYAWTLLRGRLA